MNILFEVNDTEKIILGENLHIPKLDEDEGFDWSIESMLVAMEMASNNGIKVYQDSSEDGIWDDKFNCKINGITYSVHDTNKKMVIKKI